MIDQMFKGFFGEQKGMAGTEDISSAAPTHPLRRRNHVVLIDEELHREHSCAGVVKSDEAVLGPEDFLEGLVNNLEQFI